jgi:lipopolysaccharide export system ATP-binding protein
LAYIIRADDERIEPAPGSRHEVDPSSNRNVKMLHAQNLVKSLAGRRIIEDVTLTLRRGETVGLLGPNGAGKTTTFRMLTGLLVPDSGQILLNRDNITTLPIYDRARRGISYLPQDSFAPRSLTVVDNIAMVLEARERMAAKRNETLKRLLTEFRLEALRGTRVGKLSGGQRRRFEIAATLACEPNFALLDEPFAGVDPNAIQEIATLIRHLTDRGIGVLITDHNARELLQLVDRAYIIESGRVLAAGRAETVIANEDVRRVYLGDTFRI